MIPGTLTPSEVAQGVKRGFRVLKFFPTEQGGGLARIKAMAAAYTTVRFMPTGGISAKNLEEYLNCDKIAACGGSWMVKSDLISGGRFDEIERLTAEAVDIVRKVRGKAIDGRAIMHGLPDTED